MFLFEYNLTFYSFFIKVISTRNLLTIVQSLYNTDLQILLWINHNRIKPLDNFFIFITDTAYLVAYLIPVVIFIYGYTAKRIRVRKISYQVFISLVINSLLIKAIKYIVNRKRPFEVNNVVEKLSGGGSPSFPSGHTCDAFLIATVITILYPKQRWWLIAIWIWAFMVAYSSVVLGVHYPSDVIGSMIISGGIAIIVNKFLLKQNFFKDAANS